LILIQEDNLQGNKITQAGGSINEIFRLICSDKKHYENFINLILEKLSDDYFDMNTLEIQIPDFYTILKYLIKTEIIEKLAKNKELLDISKITKHSFKPFSKSLKHAFNSSSFYFSEANDTVTQQELDNWTEVEIKTIGKEFVLDIEKIANEIKKQKEEKESSSES
jgi:hypothetical protein